MGYGRIDKRTGIFKIGDMELIAQREISTRGRGFLTIDTACAALGTFKKGDTGRYGRRSEISIRSAGHLPGSVPLYTRKTRDNFEFYLQNDSA